MGRVSREAVYCRLQVLLVATEINESYDLARVVADLLGGLALGVIDATAFGIEAKNLV